MHSQFKTSSGAELSDQLHRCADLIDGRDLKDPRISQIHHALVLVLLQEGSKDGSRPRSVLGKDVPFAHTLSPFLPRQRRASVGDVANKVKWVEVHSNLLRQRPEPEA